MKITVTIEQTDKQREDEFDLIWRTSQLSQALGTAGMKPVGLSHSGDPRKGTGEITLVTYDDPAETHGETAVE